MLTLVITLFAATSAFAIPSEAVGLPSSFDQFASDLYVQCAKDASSNLVISPYSAGVVLALTAAGANGVTFDQLKHCLHLSGDQHSIADQVSVSVDQLTRNLGNATLKTANKIYVAEDAVIRKEYKDIAVNQFQSDIESVNFADNVATASNINGWAAKHTENKIQNLLSPNDLHRNTHLVLLNAVYFKADWKYKFNKHATRQDIFNVDATQTKTTDFMNIVESLKYGEFPEFNAKAVELPYADSDITFLVIVPNEINGLPQVQNYLKNHDLQSISNALNFEQTDVTIPKFEVESKVVLNEKLKALGIVDIFGSADLSGVLENAIDLHVSQVIQKAFIKVDEEGAEAAAIAAVIGIIRPGPPVVFPPKIIRANHPFVYAIRKGGVTLFVGQFVLP